MMKIEERIEEEVKMEIERKKEEIVIVDKERSRSDFRPSRFSGIRKIGGKVIRTLTICEGEGDLIVKSALVSRHMASASF